MTTTNECIAVMKAYTEGKKIQAKTVNSPYWHDVASPLWDWSTYEYRVKPLPTTIPEVGLRFIRDGKTWETTYWCWESCPGTNRGSKAAVFKFCVKEVDQ